MADDPNSPLNQALVGLGTTIGTINEKVEAGKNRVRAYKKSIIDKLKEVVQQLDDLKTKSNLTELPNLRKQLQDSQASLTQKTQELDTTNGQLSEANKNLQQLQNNLDQINRQIEEKNEQITTLTNLGKEKESTIEELNNQVATLTDEKKQAETNLSSAQTQLNLITDKINNINSSLQSQIQMIEHITNELGDLDNGDVAEQFRAVTDNIGQIVTMLTEASSAPAQAPAISFYSMYRIIDENDRKTVLDQLPERSKRYIESLDMYNDNNKENINQTFGVTANINAKDKLEELYNKTTKKGGKRKRRTMKKRHKRTHKKMRGGYVYTSSKNLDKSSSEISSSLGSTSNSKSKTRHKTHKRKTRITSL